MKRLRESSCLIDSIASRNTSLEREDLKEAAEQTLNIIVDMDLEGCIKWVSPSWKCHGRRREELWFGGIIAGHTDSLG
jgi:hypothetical protein